MAIIPRAEASYYAATMISDGLRLGSGWWGIGSARVLAHLEIQWVWAVTEMLLTYIYWCNEDRNGNDIEEQWAEVSINAEKSWQDSYYDCRLQISLQLLCLNPMITYSGYKLEVRDLWSDDGYSEGGHMEDDVTFDILSLSSHVLSLLLLCISAEYKWYPHGFLQPLEIYQVEVVISCGPDPPKGCPQQF